MVYDDLQHQRKLIFRGVTTDGLLVESRARRADKSETIPGDRIFRIEEERNDGLARGILIGLAIGGGLALLGTPSCSVDYGVGACFGTGLLIFAVPGVVIGALIDWSVKEHVTIYQSSRTDNRLSLAPLVARRGIGAQLVWAF